jgi:Anaphase promoting complex (APC) subunit 2
VLQSREVTTKERVCCFEILLLVQLINNIITSSKQCTLERMHKLLNLLGAHRNPKYDKTEDELLEYLDVLVDKQHLRCEGSLYSFANSSDA